MRSPPAAQAAADPKINSTAASLHAHQAVRAHHHIVLRLGSAAGALHVQPGHCIGRLRVRHCGGRSSGRRRSGVTRVAAVNCAARLCSGARLKSDAESAQAQGPVQQRARIARRALGRRARAHSPTESTKKFDALAMQCSRLSAGALQRGQQSTCCRAFIGVPATNCGLPSSHTHHCNSIDRPRFSQATQLRPSPTRARRCELAGRPAPSQQPAACM